MNKIFIKQIEWGISKNNKEYVRISDGNKWYSYWPSDNLNVKAVKQFLTVNQSIDVEIKQQGNWLNITYIQGEEMYKIENSSKLPISTVTTEQTPDIFPQPTMDKIYPEEINSETFIKTMGAIMQRIQDNMSNLDRLSRNSFEVNELKMKINKYYFLALSELENKKREFSGLLKQKIDKLKENPKYSNATPSAIEKQVNKELWQEKAVLALKSVEVKHYEVIIDDIKNTIFILRDRIKYLQNKI